MNEQVLRVSERSSSIPSYVLEQPALHVTQADVGAYLLEVWGVPLTIVEAVHTHHSPGSLPTDVGFDALAAVQLADALVREA